MKRVCRVDPSLQDLDKTLRDRAARVIRTLELGAEAQSPTFNPLGEMATGRLEMNPEAVKIILESKMNDKELVHLVLYYFNHCLQILDFYTSLRKCLRQACDNQFWIRHAIMHFEEERGENVGREKYVKTLQGLQKFKEADNPFTDEYSKLFKSVYKQKEEMLQKRVTNAIFVTAFVSTLNFSVIAVAIAAPPVVIALPTALVAPIGTVGKWCDSRWKNFRGELKGKKELIDLMNAGTRISINDLVTIRLLESKLKTEIELILHNADFALGEEEEEAVKLGMLEIKKMVEVVMKTIEDLSIQANKSSHEIQTAWKVIWQRIIR
ncbi:hypothetical protein EUGRSUZ_H01229 [Eucalyptus grandis]|uniref:Uncharacterized protein n=2 Tax=Eucalyptus grandis TaxID=71139 RepID=A0ACC3JPP3_EUCGR|nr:hypothetical protein EUGRSUZ_H01229 [Eucalyptus grandis]